MISILVIEDDAAYRTSMELILRLEGFYVRLASDGPSGVAEIREKRPDLILCDIMLPGMDGHSVLEILQSERTLSDIPFIFVTAMGDRDAVRLGMSAGADDYLSKPFSSEELLAAVTGRIRRHEKLNLPRDNPAFAKEYATIRRKLTKREREVLELVGKGATSRMIAEYLGVTPHTVEVHRVNLMNKLDVVNAATLARWAVIAEQMERES